MTKSTATKLFEIAQDFPGKIRCSTGEKIGIIFKTKGMPHKQALEMIEQFLIKYKDVPEPRRSRSTCD